MRNRLNSTFNWNDQKGYEKIKNPTPNNLQSSGKINKSMMNITLHSIGKTKKGLGLRIWGLGLRRMRMKMRKRMMMMMMLLMMMLMMMIDD